MNWLRRCIYTRWFYGFLAFVCWLDVAADVNGITAYGAASAIEVFSTIASAVAALLTTLVFLDLQFRPKA